jgi:hypothetical protein
LAITCICAGAFEDKLNIAFESLIPAYVLISHIIFGILLVKGILQFWGGKIRMAESDFKYKKDESGKGSFEAVHTYKSTRFDKDRMIVGYTFLISGAFAIPFVFFFPFVAKLVSVVLLWIPTIVGNAISLSSNFKDLHDSVQKSDEEYENQKKELEEQKKREELGRWK